MNFAPLMIFIFAMLVGFSSSAARYDRIKVKEALRAELNMVLKGSSELHEVAAKQDATKSDQAAKRLIQTISKAEKKAALAGNNRQHLNKVLKAAKKDLEQFRSQKGEAKRESLKESFRSLVQLAKTYKLDDYKIYFCGKDRAVWIQKGKKPMHPIQPIKFKGCGIEVRS